MELPHASTEHRREGRDELLAGQMFVVDLVAERHGLTTRGMVLNISKGGMAVQTFRPLVQGQITEIRVAFPNAPSAGSGVVAWREQGGLAGIRFLNAPRKDLSELLQRVQRDSSPQSTDSVLPLFHYRNKAGTNAFDTTLNLFACSARALTGATRGSDCPRKQPRYGMPRKCGKCPGSGDTASSG